MGGGYTGCTAVLPCLIDLVYITSFSKTPPYSSSSRPPTRQSPHVAMRKLALLWIPISVLLQRFRVETPNYRLPAPLEQMQHLLPLPACAVLVIYRVVPSCIPVEPDQTALP